MKSGDTNVPVEKSREDIRSLLKRHGAAAFGASEDYRTGRVVLTFAIPGASGGFTPVQMPIDTQRVYEALYTNQTADPAVIAQRREQAERVAWRQLYLIIDATLTAATLGIMKVSDVFMAHTVVVSDDGRSERMADYLERTQGALAPGVRALIAAPK